LFRNKRIIRAIIYSGNKDVIRLKKIIKEVKINHSNILLSSENVKKKRVRDFNNEFGKEEIDQL